MNQDIRDELEAAQAHYLAVTAEARQRRQDAVTAALDAGDTKYAIAKAMDVRAPVVDSIIKTAGK